MFAKVFNQIFDSSIAENYELRHFFEDMLKLADSDGVVDKTPESISRRINLPLEKVVRFLNELSQPDPRSRSREHDGRRIIPLDSNRDWGWIIVMYQHYRSLRDEQSRRDYFRDAKRRQREREAARGNGRTARERVIQSLNDDPITKSDNRALRKLRKKSHHESQPTKAAREYDQDFTTDGDPAPEGATAAGGGIRSSRVR